MSLTLVLLYLALIAANGFGAYLMYDAVKNYDFLSARQRMLGVALGSINAFIAFSLSLLFLVLLGRIYYG